MAKDRLSLQTKLESILGSKQVYFQPPASMVLTYPCIIYKLDGIDVIRANDRNYLLQKRYLVTVVDRNPDTKLYEKVLGLSQSKLETAFTKDNLNQYVCSLYW